MSEIITSDPSPKRRRWLLELNEQLEQLSDEQIEATAAMLRAASRVPARTAHLTSRDTILEFASMYFADRAFLYVLASLHRTLGGAAGTPLAALFGGTE